MTWEASYIYHSVHKGYDPSYGGDFTDTVHEEVVWRGNAVVHTLNNTQRAELYEKWERRYDLSHAAMLHARWRVFQSPKAALGPEGEKRKRHGVLRALYAKRQQDPHAPGVTIFELEDLLGVPRDHLEFTLWYLKERGLLTRGDNNRFQITAAGVDCAEELEERQSSAARQDEAHLLPAPRPRAV